MLNSWVQTPVLAQLSIGECQNLGQLMHLSDRIEVVKKGFVSES